MIVSPEYLITTYTTWSLHTKKTTNAHLVMFFFSSKFYSVYFKSIFTTMLKQLFW